MPKARPSTVNPMKIPTETEEAISKAIKTCVNRYRVVTINQCALHYLSQKDGKTLEALMPMSLAEKLVFYREFTRNEVRRQFKLMASGKLALQVRDAANAELRRSLQGLSMMICIDAANGRWVASLDATPEEFAENEDMKSRIAEMTDEEAKRSRRIKNALRKYGVTSLRELANSQKAA